MSSCDQYITNQWITNTHLFYRRSLSPLLTNIPRIDGSQELNCSNCPLLTNIPHIDGLQELYCSNCPLLTNIPHIDELQELNCSYCPLLTDIPLIYGLKRLDCSNCPLIVNIPQIDSLQSLFCFDCRLLTSLNVNIANLNYLLAYGCIWLRYKNPHFNESINKLIILQKWFKKLYMSRKLKRIIPQIIPLYYHPDAKGGYFDKLKILQCFQEF
jgi:hypothetical protein